MDLLDLLITATSSFIKIYMILLGGRILLSWFPVDWSNPVLSAVAQVTDPYLNIFRSVVPPLGGLDFSPIVAFFVLRISLGFLEAADGAVLSMGF
ncbi:MAG: YggT family protein [Cyanobacteria bacterium J06639_1]